MDSQINRSIPPPTASATRNPLGAHHSSFLVSLVPHCVQSRREEKKRSCHFPEKAFSSLISGIVLMMQPRQKWLFFCATHQTLATVPFSLSISFPPDKGKHNLVRRNLPPTVLPYKGFCSWIVGMPVCGGPSRFFAACFAHIGLVRCSQPASV